MKRFNLPYASKTLLEGAQGCGLMLAQANVEEVLQVGGEYAAWVQQTSDEACNAPQPSQAHVMHGQQVAVCVGMPFLRATATCSAGCWLPQEVQALAVLSKQPPPPRDPFVPCAPRDWQQEQLDLLVGGVHVLYNA